MKFQIPEKQRPIPKGFNDKQVDAARALYHELEQKHSFIKAGMLSRITDDHLPLFVYFDDLTGDLTDEKIKKYVTNAKRLIKKHDAMIQLHPIKLSEHWSLFSEKNESYLNHIRYSIVLGDKGFLEPVAELLATGRIRPSMEALNMYYAKSGVTLKNSQKHVLQAVVDLYWAVMDASHALVMHSGKLPPKPGDMADVLEETFVARRTLEPKHSQTVRTLYELYKQIEHRSITQLPGKRWDALLKDSQAYLAKVKKLIA